MQLDYDNVEDRNPRVSEIGNQDSYNENDRALICSLSHVLRSRDIPYPRGVPPACYMKLYSKAAAAIFQCARLLSECEVHPALEPRSMHHWIQLMSLAGFNGAANNFPQPTDERLKCSEMLELEG